MNVEEEIERHGQCQLRTGDGVEAGPSNDAQDTQVDDSLPLAPSELTVVPLTSIVLGSNYSRVAGECAGGDFNALMASIGRDGLINPLTVAAREGSSEHPHGTFELIAGFRRHAAVVKLGWYEVPVCVRSASLTELDRVAINHCENSCRKNPSMVERAMGFLRLMEGPGQLTKEQVAIRCGIGKKEVEDCVHVYKSLSKEWRDQVVANPKERGADAGLFTDSKALAVIGCEKRIVKTGRAMAKSECDLACACAKLLPGKDVTVENVTQLIGVARKAGVADVAGAKKVVAAWKRAAPTTHHTQIKLAWRSPEEFNAWLEWASGKFPGSRGVWALVVQTIQGGNATAVRKMLAALEAYDRDED